jgi:hypothetical protein
MLPCRLVRLLWGDATLVEATELVEEADATLGMAVLQSEARRRAMILDGFIDDDDNT